MVVVVVVWTRVGRGAEEEEEEEGRVEEEFPVMKPLEVGGGVLGRGARNLEEPNF